MSKTFFIKPVGEAKVRDPDTKLHLDAAGQNKPKSSYWLRRIADGEVVEVSQPAEKVATEKAGK